MFVMSCFAAYRDLDRRMSRFFCSRQSDERRDSEGMHDSRNIDNSGGVHPARNPTGCGDRQTSTDENRLRDDPLTPAVLAVSPTMILIHTLSVMCRALKGCLDPERSQTFLFSIAYSLVFLLASLSLGFYCVVLCRFDRFNYSGTERRYQNLQARLEEWWNDPRTSQHLKSALHQLWDVLKRTCEVSDPESRANYGNETDKSGMDGVWIDCVGTDGIEADGDYDIVT